MRSTLYRTIAQRKWVEICLLLNCDVDVELSENEQWIMCQATDHGRFRKVVVIDLVGVYAKNGIW